MDTFIYIIFHLFRLGLADLGFFTIEQRRVRGLLIETFKIPRGFRGLDPASVFELSVNRTPNHGYKVVPPWFNTVLYRDFPTVRVCSLWNSQPEAVVNGMRPQSMPLKGGWTRSFGYRFLRH